MIPKARALRPRAGIYGVPVMRSADRFDLADFDILNLELPASGERNMRDKLPPEPRAATARGRFPDMDHSPLGGWEDDPPRAWRRRLDPARVRTAIGFASGRVPGDR